MSSAAIDHAAYRQETDRTIMIVLALALGYFAFDKFASLRGVTRRWSQRRPIGPGERGNQAGRAQAARPRMKSPSPSCRSLTSSIRRRNTFRRHSRELLSQLAQSPDLMSPRRAGVSVQGQKSRCRRYRLQAQRRARAEGSVRKARLRITAQLETATGFHVWSQTFGRDAGDVFKVQDEISTAIARRCRQRLKPGLRRPSPIADPAA
jgi:hypothetical protein